MKSHPPVKRDGVAPTYLPQTCDSRPNAEAAPLPILTEGLIIVHRHSPWPNKAHVPHKDVKELWQFIEACLSQKSTNRRDSRIVSDLECGPRHLVQMH